MKSQHLCTGQQSSFDSFHWTSIWTNENSCHHGTSTRKLLPENRLRGNNTRSWARCNLSFSCYNIQWVWMSFGKISFQIHFEFLHVFIHHFSMDSFLQCRETRAIEIVHSWKKPNNPIPHFTFRHDFVESDSFKSTRSIWTAKTEWLSLEQSRDLNELDPVFFQPPG